jgi:hypothetical protein
MRVKGLAWPRRPAGDYAAAVRIFGETLGLELAFDAGNTVELAAGNGDRIQLFGPGRRYFEFYRSHGASTVPLLEADDRIRRAPSWPAAAPSCPAGRSQMVPGPGSPSGCPKGTSTAWAPAWRSWQVRRLWSNAFDMQKRAFPPTRRCVNIRARPRVCSAIAGIANGVKNS